MSKQRNTTITAQASDTNSSDDTGTVTQRGPDNRGPHNRGPHNRGPWTVLGERVAFENPWMTVRSHDIITPGGDPGHYGVVCYKNLAMAVLPVFDNGDVTLVGQHRFPNDVYSWELPEGGAPMDEQPLAAAQRELKEETGLTAKSWREITRMHLSNSITDELAICYLATGLTQGEAEPDPDEVLAIRRIHFQDYLAEVTSGAITDSLSVALAYQAYYMAKEGLIPEPLASAMLVKAD